MIPANTPSYYGMDFGFGNDPSFVVKVYVLHETKEIYIAHENSGRVTMDQLPQLVRSVTREDGDLRTVR